MTAHFRALLGILGGGAAGYIIAVAITGLATPTTIGVAVAIVAASVIGIYLCKAIEADRRPPPSADLLWNDARRVVRRDGR